MGLEAKIEALLFAAAKPLSVKKIAQFLGVSPDEAEEALAALRNRLPAEAQGMRVVRSGSEIQLMTSPEQTDLVRDFFENDESGELTKPQLETLTVIAYRQPISKPELEQIRGVNCSLILRNLLMRGLIEVEETKEQLMPVYRVSHEFLRFLGMSEVKELPDYEKLSQDAHIEAVLKKEGEQTESFNSLIAE
ncbi:SMC-Scp complex subunit ScpB [Candidatus Uhrbacteria bacterium]|nr:SMC-Scp complex subunit ScpB [Candidatus Uhrbacteria bacterium]